jgi:type VI secretion system secreted protein VgrG
VELERHRFDAATLEGESDCFVFESARVLDLVDHPRTAMNDELVLVGLVHSGHDAESDEPAYSNSFRAVRSVVPVRPAPDEARPVAPQFGFVTGPSGQELHGSDAGGVKVRFPWDRSGIVDDRSSTWMRVGQLPMPGSMIVPRVGFEVLVDFEMGSRDRPCVVGRLYNAEAMPPHELPAGATLTSIQTATTDGGAGANEIQFEDATGSEAMLFNASFDCTMGVENDAAVTILATESSTINGNSTVMVGQGRTASVTGARTLSVGGNQNVSTDADLSNTIGGALSVECAARKEQIGGDLSESTTGTYSRSVGAMQSVTGVAGIARLVVGSSTVSAGAAWMEVAGSSRASTVGTTRTETVGALKMIKAKTVALSCGAAYAETSATRSVDASGNIAFTSGSRMAVSAGGGLEAKGASVTISAPNKVTIRIGGSSIEVKPGKVTIKSASIDVTGVKALGSTQAHNSN